MKVNPQDKNQVGEEQRLQKLVTDLSEIRQKREKEIGELDRIAKMLVRRDFALMEIKEKREDELAELKKIKDELEEAKRVLELKVEELEMFKRLAVGRELKMIELKEELAECRSRLVEYIPPEKPPEQI